MNTIDMMTAFEEIIEQIEKEEDIDLRIEENYSNTTLSIYPKVRLHNEDGDELDYKIIRISDHSKAPFSDIVDSTININNIEELKEAGVFMLIKKTISEML